MRKADAKVPVRPVSDPGARRDGWAVLALAGCPCCTARVELQVALVRLLRAQRPAGVLLLVPDREHFPALERALRERPLADYVELAAPSPSSSSP